MLEHQEPKNEEKERLMQKLREAVLEYKESREKGWAQIGFSARVASGEVEVWYEEPRQVAEVTDENIIFAEGDSIPLQFIEDVILLEKIENEE